MKEIITIVHSYSCPVGLTINPSNDDLYFINSGVCNEEGINIPNTHHACGIAFCDDKLIVGETTQKVFSIDLSKNNSINYFGGRYNLPYGIAIHPLNGEIYIADAGLHGIRRIHPKTNQPIPVAGSKKKGFVGDDGLAVNALLDSPHSIAFLPNGDLYIADTKNRRIRKIDSKTNIISTIAGNGERGYSGDGGLAINAEFNQPCGLAVDTTGNILFVVDCGVRAIDLTTLMISTVAGSVIGIVDILV